MEFYREYTFYKLVKYFLANEIKTLLKILPSLVFYAMQLGIMNIFWELLDECKLADISTFTYNL